MNLMKTLIVMKKLVILIVWAGIIQIYYSLGIFSKCINEYTCFCFNNTIQKKQFTRATTKILEIRCIFSYDIWCFIHGKQLFDTIFQSQSIRTFTSTINISGRHISVPPNSFHLYQNKIMLILIPLFFKAIILGCLTKILPPSRSYPSPQSTKIRVKFWIALQAVLGALRLYLSFSCLQYLPLGDALTIIFTEPLFTVVLSFILLKASIGFTKIILCIGLLTGMTLSIQPPFLFGPKSNNNTSDLIQGKILFIIYSYR